jgi:hypothetical protein
MATASSCPACGKTGTPRNGPPLRCRGRLRHDIISENERGDAPRWKWGASPRAGRFHSEGGFPMSTEPMSGAPSPAPLSQRDQLLAILPWWIWFVGLAAFFVQDLHPLAKRHAFWGMGYNLALSVLFGCCPLLFMIISGASGSDSASIPLHPGGPGCFVSGVPALGRRCSPEHLRRAPEQRALAAGVESPTRGRGKNNGEACAASPLGHPQRDPLNARGRGPRAPAR